MVKFIPVSTKKICKDRYQILQINILYDIKKRHDSVFLDIQESARMLTQKGGINVQSTHTNTYTESIDVNGQASSKDRMLMVKHRLTASYLNLSLKLSSFAFNVKTTLRTTLITN